MEVIAEEPLGARHVERRGGEQADHCKCALVTTFASVRSLMFDA
jgi:hypothetical protein